MVVIMAGNDNKSGGKEEKKGDDRQMHGHHGNPKFRNERSQQQGNQDRNQSGHALGVGRGPGGRRNKPHGGQMLGSGRPDHQEQQQQQMKQKDDMMKEGRASKAVQDPEGEKDGDEEIEPVEKKFTGRCRLFVGNLPNDTKEEDFKNLFQPFGEFTEVYVNTLRGFGFIRMDTRPNAESAKNALDGMMKKGRMLRVRFATHGAALRLKYVPSCITNELLENAFQQFGEVERAVVTVDDRGKPTGEGIVEFARKPGAQAALKRIREGVFLMSTTPRPIQVEPLEQIDECDGYPEKFVQKNQEFLKEREQPPRFARMGTFEFEYGRKWQQMYLRHLEDEESLKRQFEENVSKLELDMANAYMEHQTQMLREDLMKRQEELRRLEEAHQIEMARRMEIRKQEDDRRRSEEERRHMDLQMRQEDQRRQQELYMQVRMQGKSSAHLIDEQEHAMREMSRERGRGGNAPPMQPPPAPPVSMGLERGGRSSQAMGNGQESSQEAGGSSSSAINMLMAGLGGQGGSSMESTSQSKSQSLRQSRFDQPPGFQNQLGSMGGGSHGSSRMMGGGSSLGREHRMEGRMGEQRMTDQRMGEKRMSEQRLGEQRMGDQRMAEQRMGDSSLDRRVVMEQRAAALEQMGRDSSGGDEFFENKRARRY